MQQPPVKAPSYSSAKVILTPSTIQSEPGLAQIEKAATIHCRHQTRSLLTAGEVSAAVAREDGELAVTPSTIQSALRSPRPARPDEALWNAQ
jgi:hypothetical protein